VQAFVKHLTHDDYFIYRSCCLGGHSRGYKRHGTWTPFAAFEVAIGKVTVAHKSAVVSSAWLRVTASAGARQGFPTRSNSRPSRSRVDRLRS
jgi:hypothetical protein